MNISVFIEQKSSHFTVYSEDKIISSAPQGVRNKWKTRPSFSKNLLGIYWWVGFPGGISGKESACHCRRLRDTGLIPGSGRSPGGGHGNTLQYSWLENPMDRGAWKATVHRVTKTWSWLKQLSMHTQTRLWCSCEGLGEKGHFPQS